MNIKKFVIKWVAICVIAFLVFSYLVVFILAFIWGGGFGALTNNKFICNVSIVHDVSNELYNRPCSFVGLVMDSTYEFFSVLFSREWWNLFVAPIVSIPAAIVLLPLIFIDFRRHIKLSY